MIFIVLMNNCPIMYDIQCKPILYLDFQCDSINTYFIFEINYNKIKSVPDFVGSANSNKYKM